MCLNFKLVSMTKSVMEVLIIFAKVCHDGISGTLTGWAISYLMVHIFGAKPILSNRPHILAKTHYSVL